MAKETLIQFRADKELKEEVAAIYASIGLDLPTAFRMFMIRSKACKGLPFPATAVSENDIRLEALQALEQFRKINASEPELSLDEINEEIQKSRKEKKNGSSGY